MLHSHYAISLIFSFRESFKVILPEKKESEHRAALIQKNLPYAIQAGDDDQLAFIHIVPHSPPGLKLNDNQQPIKSLMQNEREMIAKELQGWLDTTESDEQTVEALLQTIPQYLSEATQQPLAIDPRVMQAIDLIESSKEEKLTIDKVAWNVNLSGSHLARLLKKDTGLTFREYVLHSKLTKSLYAMYQNNDLTEASFRGGFADQPHFTRTFKKTFGIKPSTASK